MEGGAPPALEGETFLESRSSKASAHTTAFVSSFWTSACSACYWHFQLTCYVCYRLDLDSNSFFGRESGSVGPYGGTLFGTKTVDCIGRLKGGWKAYGRYFRRLVESSERSLKGFQDRTWGNFYFFSTVYDSSHINYNYFVLANTSPRRYPSRITQEVQTSIAKEDCNDLHLWECLSIPYSCLSVTMATGAKVSRFNDNKAFCDARTKLSWISFRSILSFGLNYLELKYLASI